MRAGVRDIAGRGALALAGILLALILGEAAVRFAGVAPDVVAIEAGRFRLSKNPKIGYEPLPGVQYDGNALDLYAFRGAGNSLGYRDRDHAIAKPPGTFRIVVLGDSLGAGLYVERLEDIFPSAMEALLQQRGIRAEVINLSVSGYNTQQEVETLKERGLRYSPDLVLLAYCLNDRALNEGGIMETLLQREAKAGGVPSDRARGRWLLRSALYRFVRYGVIPAIARTDAGERDRRQADISRDTTEEYLHELATLARENRFQVLVAIFPELTNLSEYRYAGEHRRVAEISSACGFDSVDLLDTFKLCEAMADEDIGYDRYHPTPPGHHCAADSLAAFIQDRYFQGSAPRNDDRGARVSPAP
jgi:lysophospholipase L1-like esterase